MEHSYLNTNERPIVFFYLDIQYMYLTYDCINMSEINNRANFKSAAYYIIT